MSDILSQLEAVGDGDIETVLQQYNQENSQTFTFNPQEEKLRSKLCQSVLAVLGLPVHPSCQRTCLETIRILSRDKKVLAPVATQEGMLVLGRLARIPAGETGGSQSPPQSEEDLKVVTEALKCLCNIVYNSPAAQQASVEIKLPHGLCSNLSMAQSWNHDVGLFTLRLLFLLSGLRPDVRDVLRKDHDAVRLLTDVLLHTLDVRWVGPYEVAVPDQQAGPLPAKDNEMVMEALKSMFNLTLSNPRGEQEDHQFRLITGILRHLFMLKTETEDKTEEVHSHAVNLLNNLPVACWDVFIDVPVQGGEEKYGGKNLEAVQVLLDFLERRIDKKSNYKEGLTPVLSLLTEGSRCHREFRRYVKAQVLPPLRDVTNRPEVGTTFRNKVVRLMTHVDLCVKEAAAEFLFVLCKENVNNLLKYTGYGNAAGFLMGRDFLTRGRTEGQYSEEEDSDTEEYKAAKPFINPMTARLEVPAPNPMDEMTEEQKVYEADKLITMLDKLARQNVIRPMVMRPDGSLGPLEESLCDPPEPKSGSDSDE